VSQEYCGCITAAALLRHSRLSRGDDNFRARMTDLSWKEVRIIQIRSIVIEVLGDLRVVGDDQNATCRHQFGVVQGNVNDGVPEPETRHFGSEGGNL